MAPATQTDDDPYSAAYKAAHNSAAIVPFLVREQAKDGNCLFRSFSDQLYGTPDHHALVRDRCSKYLASERSYFRQFVAEPFDEFLVRIQKEGEWGDDVEIEALSEIYDCRVEIYASYTQALMRTFHEASDAKRPHPIRLQYEGHAHYNSLAPRSGFKPVVGCIPGRLHAPGELEDAAIARSRRRSEAEANRRRKEAGDQDIELTYLEVLDESVRLSRLEFEHKSEAEMDSALRASLTEWKGIEQGRMDKEVLDAILQQSMLEEEQKQLSCAIEESKDMIMHSMPEHGALYGMIAPSEGPDVQGASSSSYKEQDNSDSRDYQYPECVYDVMSMGFPLEKCIQAYHLVGDNPEGILAYCCQTLGR